MEILEIAAMRSCLILAFLSVLCGICSGQADPSRSGPDKAIEPDTNGSIKLNVDMRSEKKLRAEVDAGHQPWRLEPIDVAVASISAQFDADVDSDKCVVTSESQEEAVVRCPSERVYYVKLKRLLRPNGIWTPVEIETKR